MFYDLLQYVPDYIINENTPTTPTPYFITCHHCFYNFNLKKVPCAFCYFPTISIKCSQMKKGQPVFYENENWQITNLSTCLNNKRLCNIIIYNYTTCKKKELLFPKDKMFEIDENGCIIIQDTVL